MKYAIGAVAVLATPCLCGIVLAHGTIAVAKRETAVRASAAGGLSLTPQRVERIARVGATGAVAVANSTGRTMRVRVRVRPWRQALGGAVTPDARRSLSREVAVGPSAFRLASGARRIVSLRLRRHPSGGSLYGGIDVVGVPMGAKPLNGIVPRFRLVGSLRLSPRSQAGHARPRRSAEGHGSQRTARPHSAGAQSRQHNRAGRRARHLDRARHSTQRPQADPHRPAAHGQRHTRHPRADSSAASRAAATRSRSRSHSAAARCCERLGASPWTELRLSSHPYVVV